MKGIVPYHKTPKFGDLSPDPTSKLSNSHGKKRTISNAENAKLPRPEKPYKCIQNDFQKPLTSKENRPNIPKPQKKSEVIEKKLDYKEKSEKSRSKSSFEPKEFEVLHDKTNEVAKFPDIVKDPPPEKQNIKEKIDFINQIFDSINTKRLKTETHTEEVIDSPEKITEKSQERSPEKSPEESPEKNPKKNSEKNQLESDEEEDLNPRRSRVFPESFIIMKEIQNKGQIEKKRSKEELDERKSYKKEEASYKKEEVKNEHLYERKSYKREENSFYRKAEAYKPEKPSQSPLKKTIMKNFVQANKKNNGLGKKMYENYEKLLKCFDSEALFNKELNKSNIISKSPMSKNYSNKSPIKIKENKKIEQKIIPKPQEMIKKTTKNKVTLSRDSRRISNNEKNNETETEIMEKMNMKNFYKEISNLTKTLNKAAELMNQTFKKMETMNKTPRKTRRDSSQDSLSEEA